MSAKTLILVVDDDPRMRRLIASVMEDQGYDCVQAETAVDAVDRARQDGPDLITLDIHLGAEDGFAVAKEIRGFSPVPIIMVTGKDDVIDRVVGLELGADDYITKPFHVRELAARVKSVLRRTLPPEPGEDGGTHPGKGGDGAAAEVCFDGMRAIPAQFELFDRDGSRCDLTSGDFRLLNVFLDHPNRVLSRDRLMDLTGGVDWTPYDRTIDNQVARLRKKIERVSSDPQLIKTVRGVGYIFACDVTRG